MRLLNDARTKKIDYGIVHKNDSVNKSTSTIVLPFESIVVYLVHKIREKNKAHSQLTEKTTGSKNREKQRKKRRNQGTHMKRVYFRANFEKWQLCNSGK